MNCLTLAWTPHAPELRGWARADYAEASGLRLSVAKSRVQRARVRIKAHMTNACQVQLDHAGHVQEFVSRTPTSLQP